MLLIWLLIYLIYDCPHIVAGDGWSITLLVCAILTILQANAHRS